MDKAVRVSAIALTVMMLIPLASCVGQPDAQKADDTKQTTSSTTKRKDADDAKKTDKKAEDKGTDSTQTTQNQSSGTADSGSEQATQNQSQQSPADDLQAIVDGLVVGSDGRSDTYALVPDDGMGGVWKQCSPQQAITGTTYVIGKDYDYIRAASDTLWQSGTPTVVNCPAQALGMPADVLSQLGQDTDGQWQSAGWDGYRAIWQRSGNAGDVIIQQIG